MRLMAIDPGPVQSACVVMDDYRPIQHIKADNDAILMIVLATHITGVDRVVIEMIGHYGTGMPAGREVFDTCVWIGRFWQASLVPVETMLRPTVKAALCGTPRAKDANVRAALMDRFGGKGSKAKPGWFYGFRADEWQSYALGVVYLDRLYAEDDL